MNKLRALQYTTLSDLLTILRSSVAYFAAQLYCVLILMPFEVAIVTLVQRFEGDYRRKEEKAQSHLHWDCGCCRKTSSEQNLHYAVEIIFGFRLCFWSILSNLNFIILKNILEIYLLSYTFTVISWLFYEKFVTWF